MKSQTSIRLSEATRAKLDKLTAKHGTATEVIALAIDRLYMVEERTMDQTALAAKIREFLQVPCSVAISHGTDQGMHEDPKFVDITVNQKYQETVRALLDRFYGDAMYYEPTGYGAIIFHTQTCDWETILSKGRS
jgi:predicted DNA-binding protein